MEVCRGIDDEYRPVLETLTQALRMVDDQILARANARKATIQALAAAAPSTAVAETHAALTTALATPEVPGQVRLRTDYGYEIEDITLIPGEYWCLDEAKLLAAIKASCGTVQIPGVRVVSTSKVVAR
jgi:plasmid stability protein